MTTENKIPTAAELWATREPTPFHATSLFFDIRGSTHLLTHLGEQPLARILQVFFGEAIPATEEEGGTVLHFSGDGALVLFTGENAVDAAVRAALRLIDIARHRVTQKIPQTAEGVFGLLGHDGIDITVGIDTSLIYGVAVGRAPEPLVSWTGRGVHTAAKLSRLAPPDTIAITQESVSARRTVAPPAGSSRMRFEVGGEERVVYVTSAAKH
ncbi:adenylate/guanylate cyclase domain-containing protein [Micromonospora sp. NPDC050397]|uniref:adenylate/guanylate cyclase domain-containing protein n=1 Tax=Micromonospora sp. NPDC050397 TaxID=3364279 RepID=UPI00384D263D